VSPQANGLLQPALDLCGDVIVANGALGLVERGRAKSAGDPTTEIYDAGTLNDRLFAKLAKNVFLSQRERIEVTE
jgi:hypothetical protein